MVIDLGNPFSAAHGLNRHERAAMRLLRDRGYSLDGKYLSLLLATFILIALLDVADFINCSSATVHRFVKNEDHADIISDDPLWCEDDLFDQMDEFVSVRKAL
jgi:hypothetical protein